MDGRSFVTVIQSILFTEQNIHSQRNGKTQPLRNVRIAGERETYKQRASNFVTVEMCRIFN